ncbi:LOW QUALITY PROTEIN: DNA polymerase nu [Spinachia spinachia]
MSQEEQDRDCQQQRSLSYQHTQTPDRSASSEAASRSSAFWEFSLQRRTSYQGSQINSHRKRSNPPACLSSQAASFTQHAEVTPSLSCRNAQNSPPPQIKRRIYECRAAPWRNSTEENGLPFLHNPSPVEEDEVLFPTTVHPNAHEEGRASDWSRVVSSLKASGVTYGHTSAAQKENIYSDSWRVPRKKLVSTVAVDSLAKWNLPPCSHTKEAVCEAEDVGVFYQQAKEEGQQIVDTENVTHAGIAQMSCKDYQMQDGVTCEETRRLAAPVPFEKGSATEMERLLLSGTNKNSSLEKSEFNMIWTKSFCSEVAISRQTEDVDFEYRVNTSELPPCAEDKEMCCTSSPKQIQAQNPQDVSLSVIERAEDIPKENPLMCSEPTKFVLGDTTADHLQRTTEERMDVSEGTDASARDKVEKEKPHCCDVQTRERLSKGDYRALTESAGGDIEPDGSSAHQNESGMPPVDRENGRTEVSGEESRSTATLSQERRPNRSRFRAPCLPGNHRRYDNDLAANGKVRGRSHSVLLGLAGISAAGQNFSSGQDAASATLKPSERMENGKLLSSITHCRHPPLIPSFPLKRKHEEPQRQYAEPTPKICLNRRHPKWDAPHPPQEKERKQGVGALKRAGSRTCKPPEHSAEPPQTQTQTEAGHSQKTGIISGIHEDSYAAKLTPQIRQRKVKERCKPLKHKGDKHGPVKEIDEPKISHKDAGGAEPLNQSKAGSLTSTLTSDPRVKDSGKMNPDEKLQTLERAKKAEALLLTLVYRDGTTQFDTEQKLTPEVCGLLVLVKNNSDGSTPEDPLGPDDSLVYLKLELTPAWAQQHTQQSKELFTRDMLLLVLSTSQLVVCYKAKDLLRTALQFYGPELGLKQVAGCRIQDPQVSGWLLDPTNPSSCYRDLLNKHSIRSHATHSLGTRQTVAGIYCDESVHVSQVISGLYSLYLLNAELCFKLQSEGLWQLYSDMELSMITVLAAMESHRIHVDKEALKRLLGTKMKQLEHEAHRAAGQLFLVTSNTQLRAVLFEKLCLQERCDNKRLPKTVNTQQQSTSEAALLQLQDLHPLPKIILEYRQVHKIKSTFVDGILSCMASKNSVCSTWNQTSAVTGRISAKHPNFQALPRQPLQITKKQYVQGKEEELVTVHPRAMFVPQDGWTFLAADFCQVELRLLAHLSSDPELLRIFINPQADVFTMLASQWKGVSEGEVTSEDREHAKRIVYSVVYGAGRERLSGILGVSAEQASRFQDSFLQTYRDVQAFIQRTIQQCHKQGYVLSIMGRRRTLPNINSPDWAVRMQAERQAVNFVVQGSAADLCKMAMIRIFNLVSSSSSLSARLVAQLHDELLYEVEDSQLEQFAGLVRSTMESLQHIDHLGVHLKVSLKVAVSSGKSWGSMSELNVPTMSPSQ